MTTKTRAPSASTTTPIADNPVHIAKAFQKLGYHFSRITPLVDDVSPFYMAAKAAAAPLIFGTLEQAGAHLDGLLGAGSAA